MDLDGFIRENRPVWDELERVVEHAERRGKRLSPEEVDELLRLYLLSSSHLSTVRTQYRDVGLQSRLASLVARAHSVVYGSRARTLGALRQFVTRTFPAAVWHARRPVLISAALFLAAFVPMALWISGSEAALEAAAPPEVRQAYLEEDFEAYYSSQPASQFAALVFTNNARVGVTAFALGVFLALPTAAVLVFNGANVGLAAGLFHAAGQGARFWGLILPHGLLELTAVFIAGGAGLRLGWTVIAPGDRRRRDALAEEGRRAVVIVIGLVVVFLVAGLLEAFITPSGLPTLGRVGVGAAVEMAFVAYLVVLGREAAAGGWTGALGEDHSRPVALRSR